MATPSYLGAVQPITGNGGGWLARLGSYVGGGGTPSYRGNGQTMAASGGLLRREAPAYKPAPVTAVNVAMPARAVSPEQAAAMGCPVDPEALAAGQIAIVVPRPR